MGLQSAIRGPVSVVGNLAARRTLIKAQMVLAYPFDRWSLPGT